MVDSLLIVNPVGVIIYPPRWRENKKSKKKEEEKEKEKNKRLVGEKRSSSEWFFQVRNHAAFTNDAALSPYTVPCVIREIFFSSSFLVPLARTQDRRGDTTEAQIGLYHLTLLYSHSLSLSLSGMMA